jgi:hypothetical protein
MRNRSFSPIARWLAGVGVAAALAPMVGLAARQAAPPRTGPGPRFEVRFSADARKEPVTGRVYVAISKVNTRPPIDQTSPTGVPIFAVGVESLAPGQPATIDANTFGHPIQSLRDIPAGDYWVQPFVNVYTKFVRADGHTVWLHMDQWEGQNWKRSPGNIKGNPVQIHFDPASSAPITLVADQVIPPIPAAVDTDTVKYIKFQSQILSKWWGQPIYLGAIVQLPAGYDTHPNVKYPIVYNQGHFPSGGGPSTGSGQGGAGRGGAPAAASTAAAPRMITVQLQHPSPYYDDSYGVNSENNGPYGDAIMQELIPAIENKFRVIRERWARLLTGGSTGGWIALAHQVFYPDFYGGAFASCPDAVDFRYHQIVNIYADANAYWVDKGWMKIDRPDTRTPDGNVTSTMKDENWFELVQGDRSRSGGQWDIWEATYSPVGADGYPVPIWNKKTGEIDKKVAEYWKQHYDLRHIVETNWTTLGPKIANKINIYVGDADTYYLNMGVHMFDDFIRKAQDPKWTGEIIFQPMAPHCWGPRGAEMTQKLVAHMEKYAPAGADLKSWRY